MAEPLSAEELSDLPIFPLPSVVLFPGTTLALHLFEPRYRAMMQHCLDHGPRAFGVVLLRPGFEATYEAQPAIHAVAGVGRIAAHRKNPDGTFDLLLVCVSRARLHELPFTPPFRRARCEVIPDEVGDGALARELSRTVLAAIPPIELHARQPLPLPELEGEPGIIADRLLDRLLMTAAEKQAMLETPDVLTRLLTVAHELRIAVPGATSRLPN